MQFAAEHIGSNYGAFASDHRVLTEANLACARDFGLDQVSAISDSYRETQGFGARIVYERDMAPRCERHPLEDDPDLGRLARPDPHVSTRMRDRVDAVRHFRAAAGGKYSILGWVEGPAAEAADLRRPQNFFMDLLDDPAYAGELMDLCTDVALDFARAQVEAGADTIGVGDAVASQVSLAAYEELILPRETRLVSGIRAMGARVRLHICGNITHLLPGVATLSIDILDVDHPVDLAVARAAVGPEVALAGNLDPVAAVMRSSPARIRSDLLAAYHRAGNPFLVSAGCEIPSRTPDENLRALCEPVRWRAG
jgi:MtaA/CmuA family methyltransferase